MAQSPSARRDLTESLTNLLNTLQAISNTPSVLDAKLTEYAFVPISQVLRLSRQVPVRALELSLECISVLLCAGWGGAFEPALSGQLLILFTFLAKPSSTESGIATTSEELQALALKCMAELLTEVSRSEQGKKEFLATSNIPALGEAVLVMLDNLTENKSNIVKLRAVAALQVLVEAINDDDALASFLPKLVSSLTKVLTPSSTNRSSFRVIEQCLGVLSSMLARLLGDQKTQNLPEKIPTEQSGNSLAVSRSVSWLQATASQIKIALANVFKLRDHDKEQVRLALWNLCLCVLQECKTSLSDCTSMAVETIIGLVGHEGSQEAKEGQLMSLLASDHSLSDILRESLHGWIMAFPRVMQSKDDHSRRRSIHQISVALRLFEQDPTSLDERLALSLRDGVSTILSDSKGLEELSNQISDVPTDQSLTLGGSNFLSFQPLKLRLKGQDDVMAEFMLMIQEISKSKSALTVAQELTTTLDSGSVETKLANFWIAVNLIKEVTRHGPFFEDFVDLGTPNLREEILDDLYSHSLTVLNQREPVTDAPWQLYALALETVALQAQRYKFDFRPELSEVLYSVLHPLASSNTALREHASVCLNILSQETGYSSAGELVVANVDYIVNAVGLKLAIGDVSPQAPTVLLMMIKLCGPSLLPYLDDLIGSIFDALERYHGYPALAELLFSVLKGVTEEGVKAPQLALTSGTEEQQRRKVVTIQDVVEAVKRLEAQMRKNDSQEDSVEAFPQKPWKELSATDQEPGSDSVDEEQQPTEQSTEEPQPPAPRTFGILLKISELTQHYLTTTSPNLRNSLLSLLRTTIPALAKHENSFLPLINTLWPVLLPRVQDPEAYIASNALDIITLMCEHAGDFMRTRIEDAWGTITMTYKRTKAHTSSRSSKLGGSLTPSLVPIATLDLNMSKLVVSSPSPSSYAPELYVDAPTRMIWKSLVGLLCAIARHVVVREDRFDEMLDMLDPVLEVNEVRLALEQSNADALWLRLYKKGLEDGRVGDGAERMKGPVGKPEWGFVRV